MNRGFLLVMSLMTTMTSAVLSVDEDHRVGERTLVKATLSGKVGDTITCFSVPEPRDCTVVFRGRVPKIVAVIKWDTPDVKGATVREESREGQVPMIRGQLHSLTIEFVNSGTCEVEVVQMRKS